MDINLKDLTAFLTALKNDVELLKRRVEALEEKIQKYTKSGPRI